MTEILVDFLMSKRYMGKMELTSKHLCCQKQIGM